MKRSCNVLVVVMFIISGIFGYLSYREYRYSFINRYKNRAVRDVAVKVTEEETPITNRIDFNALKSINSDVVSWISIPGTSVDYPILVGGSDEEYLYKDIGREYSPLGSIFSYADTSRTFSDSHTFIFGHNMREYQMFGELRKYLNKDYMENHKKFYIYLENRVLECDIFSIFICDENDSIFYNTNKELGTVEHVNLLNELYSRNVYSSYTSEKNIGLRNANNQVFSLVTCNGIEGTRERLVISGVVSKENYIIR